METSVARCFGKGERISDGEREKKRKKKGRKSSEKYVFVARSGDR